MCEIVNNIFGKLYY